MKAIFDLFAAIVITAVVAAAGVGCIAVIDGSVKLPAVPAIAAAIESAAARFKPAPPSAVRSAFDAERLDMADSLDELGDRLDRDDVRDAATLDALQKQFGAAAHNRNFHSLGVAFNAAVTDGKTFDSKRAAAAAHAAAADWRR